jgi:c-di-GMP-binding flagellar brake protein YcgR
MADIPKPKWDKERIHPRVIFETAVSMITPEPGRQVLRGKSIDISEGGISARVPADLASGIIVQLEFTVPPQRDPVRVRAIVRNSIISRYGMEFLTLTPEQRGQILRYCLTLTPL